MTTAEVYILGQKYTIKGEVPKDKILEISGFIDERIKEVYAKYPSITTNKAFVLTLFNLAGELQALRAECEGLSRVVDEKAEQLIHLLD